MRTRSILVGVSLLGCFVVSCELIAGLHDTSLDACDACVDATRDVTPETCASPNVTCGAEAGNVCVDTTTDPNHCGSCTSTCAVPDAGVIDATTGNPDSGIPPLDGAVTDAAYVSAPEPVCEAGACGLACPPALTLCGDGICYDTNNVYDHCGACTTGCDGGAQWCNAGHCCATGTEYCGGACIDVLSDDNNCGSCGNMCGGMTPTCAGGVCGAGVVFTDTFTTGVEAVAQCADWNAFRAQLTGVYTSITMRGSNDPVGHTCTGATATAMCNALNTGGAAGPTLCDGNTWLVDVCNGTELNASGVTCACQTPGVGYDLRPCISNLNWGGVDTVTCSAPTQTMTVICQ
jgi:hypothetical protein